MMIQDVTIKKFLDKGLLLKGSLSDYGWYIEDIFDVINYFIDINVTFISLDVFDENYNLGSILDIEKKDGETNLSFKERGNIEIIEYIKKYYLNDNRQKKYLFYPFFDIKNNILRYPKLDLDGLILYGPYTSYSIYIDQDTDTKEYTIYLWKKDSNEDGLEFKIKNKEELQKFFEDNDILVEWEENENS